MTEQILSDQSKFPTALPLGTAILLFLGSFVTEVAKRLEITEGAVRARIKRYNITSDDDNS